MTTSIVVGSILLAANQQLGVEELTVGASADLVNRGGVEIAKDGPRHVFAAAGRGKEGFEGAALTNVRQVGIRLAIGAQAVLEEVAAFSSQLEALARLFCGFGGVTYSSQALLPSWVPAWPKWR